jgi:hypothetical protein
VIGYEVSVLGSVSSDSPSVATTFQLGEGETLSGAAASPDGQYIYLLDPQLDVVDAFSGAESTAPALASQLSTGAYPDAIAVVPPVVGVYADLTATNNRASTALNIRHWPLLADVAGLGKDAPRTDPLDRSTCQSPWLGATGQDAATESALSAYNQQNQTQVPWISYWTTAIPYYGSDLTVAGQAAGAAAASEVDNVLQSTPPGQAVPPAYVALDFEPSNPGIRPEQSALSCGVNLPPGQQPYSGGPQYKQCWQWASTAQSNCYSLQPADWQQFAAGWAAGVQSVNPSLSPAIYVNSTQYANYNVAGFGLPVFVAVGIQTGQYLPPQPPVSGSPILGYAAFYAQCGDLAPVLNRLISWGAPYNTVQFKGSGVCG